MTRQKRTRSGSVAGDLEMHRGLSQTIPWPASTVTPMPDEARQQRAQAIFEGTLAGRAFSDWTRPGDVAAAARMAIVQVLLDEADQIIATEGLTSLGGKSGSVVISHPMLAAATALQSRMTSLTRQLSQFGAQTDARQLTTAANAQLRAREAIGKASRDPLLAGFDGDDLLA